MLNQLNMLVAITAAAIVLVASARERLSSDPDPIDELGEQYKTSAIDKQEFEQ